MVLDGEIKWLQSAEIDTVCQKAESITYDEEEILWQNDILGNRALWFT